ncbi:MAG: hypothetical protein H7332_06315 [Bdellovibrionales bacterium]|nr:hypothetical protein [Ramlibacter sp.]
MSQQAPGTSAPAPAPAPSPVSAPAVRASTPAAAPAARGTAAATTGASLAGTTTTGRPEQRIERIRLEDNGTVVEEVHYGGQAQSITVSPKASVPSYEIVPADGPRSRALSRDALSAAPGQRVWNVLSF